MPKKNDTTSDSPRPASPTRARVKINASNSEEDLAQHLKSLVFLSRSATRLLDPMSEEELFEYAARQLQSIAEQAVIVVNEFVPRTNHTVVRALAGPGDKLDKLTHLLSGEAVGLTFTMPKEELRRMVRGSLSKVEAGIHGLTFGQLPIDVCRQIECDLDLGNVYTMPFMLGEDLMATVAIATDKSEELKNRGVVEAFTSQVSLAMRRKRAERDLRESEQKYRSLVENANDGIIIVQDGILKYANPKTALIGRSSVNDLIGSPITDHIHPDELEMVTDIHRRRMAGEATPSSYETVLKRSDGTAVPSELNAVVITYQGKPAVLAIIRDISERKDIERQLRQSRDELEQRVRERTAELEESRQRYRDLVELLPEMIYEADVNGRFTYANRRALERFGYTQEDLERGITNLDVIIPASHPTMLRNAARILAGEVLEGQEYIGRRKDGTEFPVYIRATAIERNGRKVGFRGVVIDLTESKKAEAETLRLEEQLWQAQKMEAIGTLAGGIAHDFNNMLAIIMGNAELACDHLNYSDSDSRHNLEQIIKASKRARDLVKQILTFSRKNKAERNAIQLVSLLKETHALLRGILPATIRMEMEFFTESGTILADPSQIQQILINLALNASYAMRAGGILTISLSTIAIRSGVQVQEAQLTPGRYAKLSVRDTGTGMTESVRKRIFEPFYSTKPKDLGTGMGLAVVYGIVTSHNGAITVKSEPGKGSLFTVFLPMADGADAGQSDKESVLPGGNERILFIDDDPEVVAMMSQVLKGLGYAVTTAESGTAGWEIFSKEPRNFDLILTDQTMPDLTGIQLAKRMLRKRKGIPIILITGYSEAVSPEKVRAIGIKGFLMKPVTRGEVAETIRQVLEGDRNRRL